MKRGYFTYWTVLLSMTLMLFVSCDEPTSPPQYSEALPAIDVPWTTQQSLICFGTSLTYGWIWLSNQAANLELGQYPEPRPKQVTTPPPSFAYPALLQATLKITVLNQGQPGATTRRAMEIVGDSVFSRDPALVLLEFGANDFLQQIADSVVEQRLGRLIDTLQLFGSKVILVSFLNAEIIASIPSGHPLANRKQDAYVFLELLRRVATNYGVLFVENAMRGIYWNTSMISNDGFHPNQAGYKRMQENISRALVNTFQKNGMLK